MPRDLRGPGRLREASAAAVGTVGEGRDLLGVGLDVGLLGLGGLVDNGASDLGQQPLIVGIDAVDQLFA